MSYDLTGYCPHCKRAYRTDIEDHELCRLFNLPDPTPADLRDAVVVFQDADGWGVRVSGRDVLRGESFTVADQLRDSLIGRPGACGEVREMARQILQPERHTP